MSSLRTLWYTPWSLFLFFFFNDTATTEIYTLSLHDALPISAVEGNAPVPGGPGVRACAGCAASVARVGPSRECEAAQPARSEEHTSELQSPCNLVCRLLLEKKNLRQPRVWVATPQAFWRELS